MSDIVVGIDLGTTNTCAAYYFREKLKVLENEEGGRTTPSFLFINDMKKVIVGQYARSMADARPEYGIYEIKRLIGRKFDDPYVQKNLRYFSFAVENSHNHIRVKIDQKGTKIYKSPRQLCTLLLRKIKKDVQSKTCQPVDKAVITVPAYFNVNQREATLAAANKAGFTVLKLLNEPTAAALNYYLNNIIDNNSCFLVYDLGGGTFDVAVFKGNGANIDTLAVDGDTHLGGSDFDNLIFDHVAKILYNQYSYNAKNDRRIIRRLRTKCEKAKKTLSTSDQAIIVLESVVKNHDVVEIDLTRRQFEQMCTNLFERTLKIVDNCLQESGVQKSDIQEVILAGGSTRIPKIQEMLSKFFNGKVLNKFVNPDECVGKGAAIQAALLSKHPEQTINKIDVKDVCPLSLGCPNFVDLMNFVIKRNTPIPTSKTIVKVNVLNHQDNMLLNIYEGERLDCKRNRFLDGLTINDLTPAPPLQCEVLLTMSIDHNGIFKFTAKERYKNNTKDLTLSYTRGHRSDKEVENILKDAKDNKTEDEKFKKFALFKGHVLNYCEIINYNLENKNLLESYENVYDFCKSSREKANVLNEEDETELRDLFDAVTAKCENIVLKYRFKSMPVLRT